MTDSLLPPPPPAYEPPPAYAPAPPQPASKEHRGRAVFAAGILGGVLGAALVASAVYLYPPTRTVVTKAPVSQPGKITIATGTRSEPVEAVAIKVTPSVVNIGIEQAGYNPYTGGRSTQVVGNGSGVIIRADGYILTNNHVVEKADRIVVRIGDEDVVAKVVGTDPSTDLAVIKVDRTGLVPAELGASDSVKVGETVVAIGSPFGLDKTVTTGIVSALHRSNLSQDSGTITQYTNLIQTDAAINPGNSGGALADLDGRVIGINTLIQTGGAQQSAGIGFAIPIDFARSIADQLIATGKAVHPYLGVSMATVDESVAAQMALPVGTTGALIEDVVVGSPAEKCGMKSGDVLVSLAGEPITSVEDAFAAIRSRKVGQTVELVVIRGSSRTTLSATLGSDSAT
ncbi:MAG: trypsin-like peptidase domain-containing protein [Coriobacteriia bacterium]|nr:trypsin-like peptidase domain-containing protein [Coriobacteriia bacterium]